jgi:hypothetical protein
MITMDSDTLTVLVAVMCGFGALFLGLMGFLLGFYTRFKSRKTANLKYSVTQLTDYDLPEGMTTLLHSVPFAINIKSVGNKKVENIRVRMITSSKLEEVRVMASEEHQESLDEKTANIVLQAVNPGETIKITGQCAKLDGIKNYVETLKITHSEGVAEKAL